jgi:hypothetical protein
MILSAQRWTAEEVARRWLASTQLAKCFTDDVPAPDPRCVAESARDEKLVAKLRRRLRGWCATLEASFLPTTASERPVFDPPHRVRTGRNQRVWRSPLAQKPPRLRGGASPSPYATPRPRAQKPPRLRGGASPPPYATPRPRAQKPPRLRGGASPSPYATPRHAAQKPPRLRGGASPSPYAPPRHAAQKPPRLRGGASPSPYATPRPRAQKPPRLRGGASPSPYATPRHAARCNSRCPLVHLSRRSLSPTRKSKP